MERTPRLGRCHKLSRVAPTSQLRDPRSFVKRPRNAADFQKTKSAISGFAQFAGAKVRFIDPETNKLGWQFCRIHRMLTTRESIMEWLSG